MASFVVSGPAATDLADIHAWIAHDDPVAAGRFLEELRAAMQRLADHPGLGHVREDLADETLKVWPVHSFLVVDRPVDDRDDEIFEALHGYAFAVGEENGAWVVECAGEHPRYRDLLLGCIATLSLDLGIETLAVQDEGDEVTLQEIADRIGKSREAVAKYSRGELKSARDPFPPPVRNTNWGARWSWSDVSTWLLHNTDWSTDDDEVHRVNVGVNALLRARREFPDLEWVKVLPRLSRVAA